MIKNVQSPEPVRLYICHETRYLYSTRVDVAQHLAYLRPADNSRQRVDEYSIHIGPEASHFKSAIDHFGNVRHKFALYTPHQELSVISESVVDIFPRIRALEVAQSTPWQMLRERLRYQAGHTFTPESEFIFPSPFIYTDADIGHYARQSFKESTPYLAGAIDLMRRIFEDFSYESESTDINTPVTEAFKNRKGVCQDFAHIMICGLRMLGLPARYVSGYLLTAPPAGQPRLQGADASHAWVSVWCPVHGWVDLDPTNNLITNMDHVVVAVGRDYGDVPPLKGVIRGGGEHKLDVAVTVAPLSDIQQGLVQIST